MAAGQDRAYTALEVVPRQYVHHMNQKDKPLPTDLGKQVVPHEGKQVLLDDGKQYIPRNDGIESVAEGDSCAHKHGDPHGQIHRLSRKKQILLGGAVALIIITAVVLGLVFGVRHKRSGTSPVTSPSNSSAIPPLTTPPQRNIAALSFISNKTNNTRVYF